MTAETNEATAQAGAEQAAAAAADAATAPDAKAPDASAESAADQQPSYEDLAAKAKLSEDLDRELKRLHGVLKTTKQENLRLRSGKTAGASTDAEPEAEPRARPARRAPEPEADDDGFVDWRGMRVTPDFAKQMETVGTVNDQMATFLTEREVEKEAERDAKEERLVSSYQAATNKAVIELRTQLIPGLEGEEATDADELVVAMMERRLEQASEAEGLTPFDLTPQKVNELGREVIGRVRRFMGASAKRQLEDNEKAREAQKVTTGGPPAVPVGKRPKDMSTMERNRLADQRQAWAEAQRGR